MTNQPLKVYNNPQIFLIISVTPSSVLLLKARFHDHRSALPRHVRGDLVALGDDAHKVGGAR